MYNKRYKFPSRAWFALGLFVFVWGLFRGTSELHAGERPNILIIFVDDMGFSDLGCYGGEIETPNLDRLSENGLRFTEFYNTSRCCPSRASLLTGLYSHQTGIGMMVYRDFGEGYRRNIHRGNVTFAEVLKTAGYQTMLSGKWHVGHSDLNARPEVRGFDRSTAIYAHVDSYWKVLRGCDIYRDNELFIKAQEHPRNPYRKDGYFYITDFFTDVALDYIGQAQKNPEDPWLLHLCYNVPHFPLETPDDLIEKYRGRYRKGWDVMREEKLVRMKRMGLVGDTQTLPRIHGFVNHKIDGFNKVGVRTELLPSWDSLSAEEQDELDFRRAMYAGQIDNMDQNIGRIVEKLKTTGALDNTLIFFMSDNGCSGELGHFGMNWGDYHSGNYAEWKRKSGWSISQGQCWAAYSNTPFRMYKKFVHEGGIASPMIVHWPKGIKSRGDVVAGVPFHLIDVMPTLCDVAGVEYPEEFNGNRIPAMEGVSMRPWFENVKASGTSRTLFWQHENHAAVREGDWKLVTLNDRDEDAWMLYNLAGDRSETFSLNEQHPGRAERMKAAWQAWAQRVQAVPFPEQR